MTTNKNARVKAGAVKKEMNGAESTAAPSLLPDLAMAAQFIEALTGSADTPCTWQTFDDYRDPETGKPRKLASLARVLHGSLAECAPQLQALNAKGAGIFVTVNETDLKGRKAENVIKVRACPQDFDAENAGELANLANEALQLSIGVQSSPGKYHGYWRVKDVPLAAFTGLQERLNAWTGADPSVKDLPRVLRLPGFWHMKNPAAPFMTKLEFVVPTAVYSMADIETVLAQVEPAAPRPDGAAPGAKTDQSENAAAPGTGGSTSPEKRASWPRVEAALRHVPNNPEHPREHWTTIAHAVRNACGPEHAAEALRMFIAWSQQWGEQEAEAALLWAGLKDRADGAAGMGTLVRLAREAGWDNSIPADLALPFIDAAIASADAGALFELDVLEVVRGLGAADYARVRQKVKDAKRVNLRQWEQAVRDSGGNGDGVIDGVSAADVLIEAARERCELLHNADGEAVAVITDDVRQVFLVKSAMFKDWLSGLMLACTGKGCGSQTMDTVVNTLHAVGVHQGAEVEVHRRWAWVDGALWLDLCDDKWSVIHIDADGWRYVAGAAAAPPLFVRSRKMRPYPEPLPLAAALSLGSFESLWQVANIPSSQRLLFLAALCEACRPNTPHLVVEFLGVQGSAKSSTQRVVRDLVDPNAVPLRAAPRDVEAIFVAVNNAHTASFENLSHLTTEQQDAMCALATGAGYAKRKQYTDGDEAVIDAKAPTFLNGISAVCSRPDLLDRAVLFALPAVEAKHRLSEAEVDAAWGVAYPVVFGALLGLLSGALKALPGVVLPEKPRMADFTLLGVAVARVLGLPDAAFLDSFAENRTSAIERALESSVVALPLQAFMAMQPVDAEGAKVWRGMVGELFEAVRGMARDHEERFPRSSQGFGNALRRIIPALQQLGLTVNEGAHTRTGKPLTVRWVSA